MTFKWKDGARISADAQVAGVMCSEMEKAGTLTAQNLVDANRPETAPLHNEFEWNDTEAAEKWRVHQARHIINSIVVVTEEAKKDSVVRCFFKVAQQTANYESITTIVKNEDKYMALLETAVRELRAFERKYSTLQELSDVFKAIHELEV